MLTECGLASRNRKICKLRLDLHNEANEHFCQAPSKVALNSDLVISSLPVNTTSQKGKQFVGICLSLLSYD